jgi:hypothetical protein
MSWIIKLTGLRANSGESCGIRTLSWLRLTLEVLELKITVEEY